jgi:L-asparagine oxygenase
VSPPPLDSYTLTAAERASVEYAVHQFVPPYRPDAYHAFMEGCREAVRHLPAAVQRWRHQASRAGLALLRNVPVGLVLPPTPRERIDGDAPAMWADAVAGVFGTLLGTVFTIDGKSAGRHIHDIFPVQGDECTQLGSSQAELIWHVEEAFHPLRPTWLALLCLRGDRAVTTRVALARHLTLSPSLVAKLRERRFKILVDETYGSLGVAAFVTTSILAGPNDDPEIVLDPAYTLYEDGTQAADVAAVSAAAERAHISVTLDQGDLLVFDNRRAIHARTSFAARMDGSDRWLKRVFILDSATPIDRSLGGRVPFCTSELGLC